MRNRALSITHMAVFCDPVGLTEELNVASAKSSLNTQTDTDKASENGILNACLIAIGKSRDKEAFIKLFEHYAPRIKSYFIKGGTNFELADELVQETMLAIWNKAHTFDPAQANAGTWIFTIARNKRIDNLRKYSRPLPDPNDPAFVQSSENRPEDVLELSQNSDVLSGALSELPEEQSELLLKSFYEDKSHQDIADETGLPLGTVKSRIRLALNRLRKSIMNRGDYL